MITESNTYNVPPGPWHDMVEMKYRFTPDIATLQRYGEQRLFVYDEMLPGHNYHEILHSMKARDLATAFTYNPYSLYTKKLGLESFPVAMKKEYNSRFCSFRRVPFVQIKGELYAVTPDDMVQLDNYKQNGVEFKRVHVDIYIPYRKRTFDVLNDPERTVPKERWFEKMKAWMYIGCPEFWDDQIDVGYEFAPVETFRHKTIEYYFFTRMEYEK